jgi:hypothetical protein
VAAGDLSPDQARFVDQVTAATGLDRNVVVAWVGSESVWGSYKPTHNYLNIGPGRTYVSVDQAAAAAASLINGSPNYAGIRAAIPAGPAAQVSAIGASVWGTSGSVLGRVWAQLTGAPTDGATPATSVGLPNPLDVPGAIGGLVTGKLGKALGLDAVAAGVLRAGMTIVFTIGALGLIALGLNRLTARDPKALLSQMQGLMGNAGQAAKLAAVAAA